MSLETTRDLDVQGHASRLCSWLLFDCILWPIECKKQKKFTDLACILPEIGKVTCNHAWPWRTRSRVKVTELVVNSLHSLTHRMWKNKKKFIDLACILPEIGKVTCNHAWPWRTRSRVRVTELVVISLHSLTHRMQETKKNHRSSMYTIRDRKGHL